MNIPKHIAIIPDGNRRWAKQKGLPAFEGHRFSADKILPRLIEKSSDLGIKYFTFWALSTENIKKRSSSEIEGLFSLIRLFLKRSLNKLMKNGVQIRMIGDLTKLPNGIQNNINEVIEKTRNNKKIIVIFAINYGGREEIVRAFHKIRNSKFEIRNLNSDNISQFLDTKNIPDPDLIIRTGGEKRLSGFLPWQSVYSELYFTETYFPDFDEEKLTEAVNDYSLRQRRFGK